MFMVYRTDKVLNAKWDSVWWLRPVHRNYRFTTSEVDDGVTYVLNLELFWGGGGGWSILHLAISILLVSEQ